MCTIWNWGDQLMSSRSGLPLSMAQAGWRNGPIGTLLNSTRTSAKCCSWEGLTPDRDTGEGLAREQLWEKGLQRLGRLLSTSPQRALTVMETSIWPLWAGAQPVGWENIVPLYLAPVRPCVDTASSLGPPICEGYQWTGASSGGQGWSSCPVRRSWGTGLVHPRKIKVCLLN